MSSLFLKQGLSGSVFRVPPTRASFPPSHRLVSTQTPFFKISDEVRDAIESDKPVVALETTIYTHGFPYPDNIALCSRLEGLVRVGGGIPATIGVLNGVARVGFEANELLELLESSGKDTTLKVSRRDLAYICGLGIKKKRLNGGTTVSGTMLLAHLAGIKVFATGGLGGVHKDGENSMDISADLTELGRTPVAVISSGCKSFLDIPKTLEYLETQGVCVCTFADGRTGNVDLPAFWTRDSGIPSPRTISNEAEAAAIIYAQSKLPVMSGLLFANPIPDEYSLSKSKMDHVMSEAVRAAEESGVSGSTNTPFVLAKIRELTDGATVKANSALVENNVIRGTRVAVELGNLALNDKRKLNRRKSASVVEVLAQTSGIPQQLKIDKSSALLQSQQQAEVFVAGSLAVDTNCNYNPDRKSRNTSGNPDMHTSNPAIITQSLGGVGQNVASALHYLGKPPQFCSAVAADASGQTAVQMLANRGMRVDGVKSLHDGSRTAQYIAFNNTANELVSAMADMRILENSQRDISAVWGSHLASSNPRWLVVDANWDSSSLKQWVTLGKAMGMKTAFEPVSVGKSRRVFAHFSDLTRRLVHIADLATPNASELRAMSDYVSQNGHRERAVNIWTLFLNSLRPEEGFKSAQNQLAAVLKAEDNFILGCSLKLLPYFPCILTKIGSSGVLLTELLHKDDKRLTDSRARPYIYHGPGSDEMDLGTAMQSLVVTLRRQTYQNPDERIDFEKDFEYLKDFAGVYMRLLPPAETVPEHEIVSVNGVGDTFLGVLIAGLAKDNPKPMDELVMLAQRGAVMTLKSRESVSEKISSLRSLL
ncbi:hypothetical protein MMC26_001129 [Xylographa opegraphella]|nr:hypothetical protein [Xylographa opegraphella]